MIIVKLGKLATFPENQKHCPNEILLKDFNRRIPGNLRKNFLDFKLLWNQIIMADIPIHIGVQVKLQSLTEIYILVERFVPNPWSLKMAATTE